MELVVDIETCGLELEELSESQQEFLIRYAEEEKDAEIRNEKLEDVRRYLSLYPFTAAIVCMAFMNIENERSFVICNSDEDEEVLIEDKNIKYKMATEKTMLENFWYYAGQAKRVITFNGRCFDFPFIALRSAMMQVKPTKKILGNRYDTKYHIDLLEQFTHFGLTRKFNLDFYCHAFNIESPKSRGITGMEIKEMYKAGKTREIGVYCADDVRATYELYKIWKEYIACS